ncbi:MAG TPA: GH92 family glycosyl hydrolase [Pricia sp.]|nr:GH92 family glycosyl hydrolase [Pricia sp.]
MLKKQGFFFLFSILTAFAFGQKTVWEIGKSDNSASEFALAPSDYGQFLKNDFGWEDRFFALGFSKTEKDFPYVLPGTVDYWGGTSGLAGIRPHELNLLFALKGQVVAGKWQLVIDILDCSPENPPLFKVTVNGRSWKFRLEKGSKGQNALEGSGTQYKEQKLEIPLPPELLRKGGNEIELTSLGGSWLVFDNVQLLGPEDAELVVRNQLFLRNASAADYEINVDGKRYQPLLVDLQYLEGTPNLSVHLDGTEIFSKKVVNGSPIFEVPMDAVTKSQTSAYEIFVDDTVVKRGEVLREPKELVAFSDYIDTKIGTGHSRWMIAPGPWMPFGMVKISPDNQESGWQAGYQPTFENVGAFSHIHEWTMAGLGTLPTNGQLKTKVGTPQDPDSGYRSRVDKATEKAPLGYYSVVLSDYDIKAELTATTRCSFQRFTYPKNRPHSRILIDLKIPAEYDYRIEKAYLEQVSPTKIVGYSRQITSSVWGERHYRKQMVENGDETKAWDDIEQDYTVHFVMEFDRPIKKFGVWADRKETGTGDTILVKDKDRLILEKPEDVVAFVEFDTTEEQVVQTRTGLSYVSIDNAALNLKTEIERPFGWNFEKVRKNQEKVWNNLLKRVRITTKDKKEKIRFYSNMYRAIVSRNIFSDVDGSWIDATEKPQKFKDPNGVALGCDAFWNTFWNLNQFWNLVVPEWSSKWVNSQLAMYDANGWLAKGPAGMEYIPVMVAEHEIALIVGAFQMGIGDFDVEKAFEAVHKMQTTPGESVGHGYAGNRDLEAYLKYKYVPYNKGRFSNTLEYSFDDFAVSQMAKALGKKQVFEQFIDRAYWWKNAMDPKIGFARLRHSDGSWYQDFDPIKTGGNHQYVEGNAWQLSFFVPQDVPALVEMIGEKRFVDRLNEGFKVSSPWRYNAPNELYWDFPVIQGNQQSMHFSYLFNWAKRPWLTQKWSRDIMERYYGFGVSNAYLGDEDQGQMSAWFVMSAMGLFQTDGGTRDTPIYEIGSPLFEKTVIDLGGTYGRGKTFTIEAKNASHLNKYVQSAKLNGKKLMNFWFPASELLRGGKLELVMGEEPNKNWGVDTLPASPR